MTNIKRNDDIKMPFTVEDKKLKLALVFTLNDNAVEIDCRYFTPLKEHAENQISLLGLKCLLAMNLDSNGHGFLKGESLEDIMTTANFNFEMVADYFNEVNV